MCDQRDDADRFAGKRACHDLICAWIQLAILDGIGLVFACMTALCRCWQPSELVATATNVSLRAGSGPTAPGDSCRQVVVPLRLDSVIAWFRLTDQNFSSAQCGIRPPGDQRQGAGSDEKE